MRAVVCVSVIIAGMTFSSVAIAATVEPQDGKSYLNRGSGFRILTGPKTANAGDTVMASTGGSAVITYDDGCKEHVNPGEVVTIKPVSPCKEAVIPPEFAVGAVVVGAIAGGIILLDDDKPSSP